MSPVQSRMSEPGYRSGSHHLLPARPLRVVCIGAGLSGIYLGVKLPEATKNVDLTIYEKNAGVGGTWYENTYPGCACDIPAHRYCYTFAPNPDWSTFYAPAPELRKYFDDVATKYDVHKYIRLSHSVVSAIWCEDSGKWKLKIKHGDGVFDDECDVLVGAMGVLNNWKWPDVPGLHSFKGKMLHSAHWDHDVDFEGQRVAVVGSGSSAIQIIPSILPKVAHLGAYLRSPSWITPPLGLDLLHRTDAGDYIFDYTKEQRKRFLDDPEFLLAYRRDLERGVSKAFRIFTRGSKEQIRERGALEKSMRERLAKKPELADKMIPNWDVGCRRMTPGIGYLESLCEDKVDAIFDCIREVTATGVTSASGRHVDYDILVCATGFDVSYGSRFPFIGRDQRQLDENFRASPEGYFAVAYAGFPNFFQFNGPNAPVGAGSLVPATEAEGDYIVKAINKIQRQGIKSMVVKDECVREFTEHSDAYMETTVWTAGCRSWFKNGQVNGRVSALWPGSGLHFIDALEDPRWEDYHYTYPENRYHYLGNGFTQLEMNEEDRTTMLGRLTDRFKNHPALLRKAMDDRTHSNTNSTTVCVVNGNGKASSARLHIERVPQSSVVV